MSCFKILSLPIIVGMICPPSNTAFITICSSYHRTSLWTFFRAAAQLPTAVIYTIAHPRIFLPRTFYSLHLTDIVTRHSFFSIHGIFFFRHLKPPAFRDVTGTLFYRIRGFGKVIIPRARSPDAVPWPTEQLMGYVY